MSWSVKITDESLAEYRKQGKRILLRIKGTCTTCRCMGFFVLIFEMTWKKNYTHCLNQFFQVHPAKEIGLFSWYVSDCCVKQEIALHQSS